MNVAVFAAFAVSVAAAPRIPHCHMLPFRFAHGNRLRHKISRSFAAGSVNVLLEPLIRFIKLTKALKNFFRAVIKILADEAAQLFRQRLGFLRRWR